MGKETIQNIIESVETESHEERNDDNNLSILQLTQYTTLKTYDPDDDSDSCVICRETFANDDILRKITVCSHIFHHKCVDTWFNSHSLSPICRKHVVV